MSQEPSEPAVGVPEGSSLDDDSRTASPFAAEPKPSIGYLLVWATCVAVYASAQRTLDLAFQGSSAIGGRGALGAVWTVLAGTYLAGLVLMVSRRRHHRPFPRSGGEMIWVFGGLGTVESLLIFGWMAILTPQGFTYSWYMGWRGLFAIILWLPLYIYSIRKYAGQWRAFFAIRLFLEFITFFANVLMLSLFVYGVRLFVDAVLLLIVTLFDLRRHRHRYPWPHWFGIVLCFASLATSMLSLALR